MKKMHSFKLACGTEITASMRALNVLERYGIDTMDKLRAVHPREAAWLWKNCGRKTVDEIMHLAGDDSSAREHAQAKKLRSDFAKLVRSMYDFLDTVAPI